MKVTAIIPDDMINEAMELSKTETIKVVLFSYIQSQKIKQIAARFVSEPLEFTYSAQELRDMNRI